MTNSKSKKKKSSSAKKMRSQTQIKFKSDYKNDLIRKLDNFNKKKEEGQIEELLKENNPNPMLA